MSDSECSVDEVSGDEDVAESCNIFSNYKPAKLNIGLEHPQELCEGSGLSCVLPPDIYYKLKIPSKFYEGPGQAHISNAQLETVVYACQSHEIIVSEKPLETLDAKIYRQGFLIGDGTGTGKSRELAALIFEYSLCKMERAIWITANEELFSEAIKEVRYFLPNKRMVKISVLAEKGKNLDEFEKHVVMLSYASLTIKKKLDTLYRWMGDDYDGLMIFDEAHYAKAALDIIKPSAAGVMVLKLQDDHPMARIVYSSATVGSEPHHLLYMTRLSNWGADKSFKNEFEFRSALEKGGVKLMELLAMEMKMRGVFLARQISYAGVELKIGFTNPKPSFPIMYQRCCQIWTIMCHYIQTIKKDKDQKQLAKILSSKKGSFYSNALNFFQSLTVSSKLEIAEEIARTALSEDKSVVFGIQHTGEAQFRKFLLEKCVKGGPYSNAAYILRNAMISLGIPIGCSKLYLKTGEIKRIGQYSDEDDLNADTLFRKSFVEDEAGVGTDSNENDPSCEGICDLDILHSEESGEEEEEIESAVPIESEAKRLKMSYEEFKKVPEYSLGYFWGDVFLTQMDNLTWSYEEVSKNVTVEGLGRLYHELCPFLPINPLHELHDRLSDFKISELTGNRLPNYYYIEEDNKWVCESKPDNVKAMKDFMNMDTRICIISNAGSIGCSLHSDKASINQQQRVHITLEYPWSPDKLQQQLGRTHRSNQVNKPKYYIINSGIPGEIRFESVIAKRLRQLGAICHGQALANPLNQGLSDVVCTPLGIRALNGAIRQLRVDTTRRRMVDLVMMKAVSEKKSVHMRSTGEEIARTFNRNLMLPLELQSDFIKLLNEEIDSSSEDEKRKAYSPIVEYSNNGCDIKMVSKFEIEIKPGITCQVYTFQMSRVARWDTVLQMHNNKVVSPNECQFYHSGTNNVMFALMTANNVYQTFYPHNRNPKIMNGELLKSWTPCDYWYAAAIWENQVKKYEQTPGCIHKVTYGRCPRPQCKLNWGVYEFVIVCGYTTQIWNLLQTDTGYPFQLARVNYTDNGESLILVGIVLEDDNKDVMKEQLRNEFKVI